MLIMAIALAPFSCMKPIRLLLRLRGATLLNPSVRDATPNAPKVSRAITPRKTANAPLMALYASAVSTEEEDRRAGIIARVKRKGKEKRTSHVAKGQNRCRKGLSIELHTLKNTMICRTANRHIIHPMSIAGVVLA